MKHIDKTLYSQCREYIKLCLLIEELQVFKDEDGEYTYNELINQTLMQANLLLREFSFSLKRIRTEQSIQLDLKDENKHMNDVLNEGLMDLSNNLKMK
jgi:hypothetical protein